MPGRGADVDVHAVAGLIDGLVEAEQHVFAHRLAVERGDGVGLVAARVLGLGADVEDKLRAPILLLAAEHFDVVLAVAVLTELFILGVSAELGQAGGVGLGRGLRLARSLASFLRGRSCRARA